MNREEAFMALRQIVEERFNAGLPAPGKERHDIRQLLEITKPEKNWDHMEEQLEELLGPISDLGPEDERMARHEALSIIFGVLFPEWETGDFEPDLEFLTWLGKNLGWHGFDRAAS